jgi:Tfp pilus assembly protein PilF
MEQAADAMHKGDLDVAALNLRRALELDPHSLAALNNLGIVLSREGKPAEAIPLYQRALKVSPEDMATKRNLAVAYFKAERYPLGMVSAATHGRRVPHRLSDSRLGWTLPVRDGSLFRRRSIPGAS